MTGYERRVDVYFDPDAIANPALSWILFNIKAAGEDMTNLEMNIVDDGKTYILRANVYA